MSNPMKAQLRRFMGISADSDSKVQSRQSQDFRCDVRMLAGIYFTEAWTGLRTENGAEDVTSALLLHRKWPAASRPFSLSGAVNE